MLMSTGRGNCTARYFIRYGASVRIGYGKEEVPLQKQALQFRCYADRALCKPFDGAKFRQTQDAIRLHLLLDHKDTYQDLL